LLTAFAEAGNKQPKATVEYLDKFIKHCKDNKLGTDGIRKMLEQTPQLESVRTSQEFQQFIKKLPQQ
jgi:DNA-binding transcriptional MerR regulator